MEVITSYCTNVGNVKQVNQDSLAVKVVNSPDGKIVFAIICDGMGGLEQGELASKEVVMAFHKWFMKEFAVMVERQTFSKEALYHQWQCVIEQLNEDLGKYAEQQGIMMGTTLSVLLIYQKQYYICHVGDSRIYKIEDALQQITKDHTLVAQEVELGLITKEQALNDMRRSILLQCIGASKIVEPQYETGEIHQDVTFLLTSDGFVHYISDEELFHHFKSDRIREKEQVTKTCEELTSVAMQRGERDNITVISITLKM